MANAADYLTFSTQQVLTNYKLRTRTTPTQEVTVTNTSNIFRITVLIEDTFDGSQLSPNQLVLEPLESKTFKITYDLTVMESLPVGIIPATINFTATAEPIVIPPPPPPPLPPPPPPPPIVYPGCTNPSAINYNPVATVDNGSCVAKIYGCTNRYAINYNPKANIDDGTCIIREEAPPRMTEGCTNRTALNYNPNATQDDGSCIPQIVGCQDNTALNYNPNANTTGQCIYRPPIEGCTDERAINYNSLATVDRNDQCVYLQVGDPPPTEIIGCMDPAARNYNPNATRPAVPDICQPYLISGCTGVSACNYNPAAQIDDGSCYYPGGGYVSQKSIIDERRQIARESGQIFDESMLGFETVEAVPTGGRFGTGLRNCLQNYGCTDSAAINYNPRSRTELGWSDDGSCIYVLPPNDILGCMDPAAVNYNPQATVSVNECIYTLTGCTNPTAANYNPQAQQDDGLCIFTGCKDPSARNYDPSPNIAPCLGCCLTGCECANLECPNIGAIISQGAADSNGFAQICRAVQGVTNNGNGCSCPSGCDTVCNIEYVGSGDVYGCRDAKAVNYNPLATIDTGTCEYRRGCTSATAVNYNPLAQINDGSCVEATYGCGDPTAINYNPTIQRNDGSCKYNVFGCTDYIALNFNPAATQNDGSCVYYVSGGGGNEITGTGDVTRGGGGGGRMDVENTLITGTVGGDTIEMGGRLSQEFQI